MPARPTIPPGQNGGSARPGRPGRGHDGGYGRRL